MSDTTSRTQQAFSTIRYTRNLRIEQVANCPLLQATEDWHRGLPSNWAYEEWLKCRRDTVAFIHSMPRPEWAPKSLPQWYAWNGYSHRQTFATDPLEDGEAIVRAVECRGPLFSPTLWERYVEAERAMAPASYAVTACCVAFIIFAVYWSR